MTPAFYVLNRQPCQNQLPAENEDRMAKWKILD